jgi:DNA-binding MarR family transcriptional regulator
VVFLAPRIIVVDAIIHVRYIIHLMRTISVPEPNATRTAPGTSADPLIESIVAELHQMVGSLRCAGTGRMVKAGISMTHLHILWVLDHHGELPMSRLAELLDVSFSNATGLVDRMEERGLVERVRVPGDRRVVIVRASAEGIRIRDEIEALKQDRMRSILAHLRPNQLTRLLGAIGDLRGALVEEIGTDHLEPHAHPS